MSDNRSLKAVSLLLLLSAIWGTSFILIKQGLKVFGPKEVGALRVSAAFIFLLPVALTQLKGLVRKDYRNMFVSGMLGVFIPAFLFATAQTHISSSVAGILNTLSPLMTMMVGALFFGQRFKGYAIIGLIIGLVGTGVLMTARSGGNLEGINLYTLLIVFACFLYGLNLNWVKFKIQNVQSLTITSVSLMLIGPMALIYLLVFSDFIPIMQTAEGAMRAFGLIVLLGCMSTAVAMYIFNTLVKITTPLFASSVTYIMPIVSVMWGLLDGEQLLAGHYIGMIAIIGGVYLANKK